MRKFQAPKVPFVEAYNVGGKQKPTAIVLSLSSTTSEKGAALGIANNLHKANAPMNSYHYVVDAVETYRCVFDNVAAYSSPYRAIDILVCAEPLADAHLWSAKGSTKVLRRAADLVADLLLFYKIPVRYLDEEAELSWFKRKWRHRGGIIVAVPGAWPYDAFMTEVRSRITLKTKS